MASQSLESLVIGPDAPFLARIASIDPVRRKAAVRRKDSSGLPLVSRTVGSEAKVRALLAAGAGPSAEDNKGQAPVHWAARLGDEGALRALIEAGADPEARRMKSGNTPLHLACLACSPERVRVLLDAGVALDPANDAGQTPRDLFEAALADAKSSGAARVPLLRRLFEEAELYRSAPSARPASSPSL